MMVGQEMHVRWRHHQAGLLAYLRQMLASEVFVDVHCHCNVVLQMMVGQEMHVRWRHHQAGLLAYLRQMLASEVFVDVTLCCQNKRLKAHRVLLSACSPYLQVSLLYLGTIDFCL
jgi:hypothetical protein